MINSVCVYCSSSNNIDQVFVDDADILGHEIASRNWRLIYGGSHLGLMGTVARAAYQNGAQVTGVMTEKLVSMCRHDNLDELIIEKDMRSRRARMEELADAFIVLPGGIGTLEEFSEQIVARTLRVHEKPIIFVNIDSYYDSLIQYFTVMHQRGFDWSGVLSKVHFVDSSKEAVAVLGAYTSVEID